MHATPRSFVAVPVVLAGAFLGLSGCTTAGGDSETSFATFPARPAAAVVSPPISGVGPKKLDPLSLSGTIHIDLTCRGSGTVTVVLPPSNIKIASVCSSGDAVGGTVASGDFPLSGGVTAHGEVTADAKTAWKLAIYEAVPTSGTKAPVT